MPRYYQGNGFHAVTDKSPNGMEGVLFMGKGGESVDKIGEHIYTREEVATLSPISENDIPDEWRKGLGCKEKQKGKEKDKDTRKKRIIFFAIVFVSSIFWQIIFWGK